MKSKTVLIAALLFILLSMREALSKPMQHFNPVEGAPELDPEKIVCTTETATLCQQCAKKTKSAVVYPWCCANHEGVRDWCYSYLYFGLP